MNCHTDIVISFYWRGVLSRACLEERLFRKPYFLKGCSLERGALTGEWALIRSFTVINPKIPFTGINIVQNAFRLLFN